MFVFEDEDCLFRGGMVWDRLREGKKEKKEGIPESNGQL